MPRPRGSSLTRDQIARIAKLKIAGKPQSEIAEAVGVSRSTVSHTPAPVKAMIQEFSERNRQNLIIAADEMVAQLRKDMVDPKLSYSDRDSAARRLFEVMALGDRSTGATNPAQQQQGGDTLEPVPMPDLLRHYYRTTDRVIIEREVQHGNGVVVNGNGKVGG